MSGIPLRLQRFMEDIAVMREGAVGQVDEIFTDDLRFRDPFRETSGLPAFRKTFTSMFRRYPTVGFTDFSWIGDDSAFTLTYTMRVRMAVGPTFALEMASLCQTRGGKIYDYVDYYDLMKGLTSPLPLLNAGYRKVVGLIFL